jgi:hypothetical protein
VKKTGPTGEPLPPINLTCLEVLIPLPGVNTILNVPVLGGLKLWFNGSNSVVLSGVYAYPVE